MLEKEKLLIMSNFSFSFSVFKGLVLQTRKNLGLFGIELTSSLFLQIEKRPQAGSSERQGALSVQNNASVPPTSNKPIIPNKTGMHTSSVMVGDGIPRTPPFPRQNNVASAQNLSQKEDKESRDQPAPLPNIKQQKSPLQQQQTQQQQNKGETQTGSSSKNVVYT